METTDIKAKLEQLPKGARVRVELADGTHSIGAFNGIDGDQVHVEGSDDVDVAKVENVLMDVSTDGDE